MCGVAKYKFKSDAMEQLDTESWLKIVKRTNLHQTCTSDEGNMLFSFKFPVFSFLPIIIKSCGPHAYMKSTIKAVTKTLMD